LDEPPSNSPRFQRSARESNSVHLLTTEACRRRTRGPIRRSSPEGPPENRTRSTSLQERDATGTPTDHPSHRFSPESSRRESNPRLLFVREESLPLDHGTSRRQIRSTSTGGIRTHRHQTLSLIAMPIRVPCHRAELRARESNHGRRIHETRLSSGPPAMSGSPRPYEGWRGTCHAWRVAPRGIEPPSPP
jgi:hypothetical protein